MYSIYLYENRRMILGEVILNRGGERGRMMEVMNLTKVHFKFIWKCDSEPPVQLINARKTLKKPIHHK
jgi:hypothetical protein